MKSRELTKRIIYIVLAVLFGVLCFCCGYLTRYFTVSTAINSYAWAKNIIKNNYYKDIPDEEFASYTSVQELVENCLDEYSAYYTQSEYSVVYASNAGSKSGIGVSYSYVDASIGKGIFLNSVFYNSPAYLSGLSAGTFVYSGKYYTTDGTEKLMEFNSTVDLSQFVSARAEGEQFVLVTDHGEYTMAREDYTQSYCFMSTNSAAWTCAVGDDKNLTLKTEDDSRVISYLPDGCAYLSLSQFYGYAPYEMAALFKKFNEEGCTSLIFDLRSNGGGYVEVMQYISSLFLGNRQDAYSVAMTAKYKNGNVQTYNVKNFASSDCLLPADTKVYIMANNGTASASEALMGVLISNNVVSYSNIYISDFTDEYLQYSGTTNKKLRTYGKGIMQTPFTNNATGEVLKLTTAQIYWPNDNCIHDRGITVEDGCNAVSAEWVKTYTDNELKTVVNSIFS
jgi:C-terminal processing protease CtpA/Prc